MVDRSPLFKNYGSIVYVAVSIHWGSFLSVSL